MDKEIQECVDTIRSVWTSDLHDYDELEKALKLIESHIILQEKIKELMAKSLHSAMGWDWQISSAFVDKNFTDLAKKELGL